MSSTMELSARVLEQIGAYVKSHLREWQDEQSREASALPAADSPISESRIFDLGERTVRVEEALRHQGEILERGLDSMDKRFEAVDKRFEAVDKRFEAIDKRFEAVDKRFEEQLNYMNARFDAVDKRFEEQLTYMNARFDAVDKRFGEQLSYMNTRFDAVDKRFEEQLGYMNGRFDDMHRHSTRWMTVLTLVVAFFGMLPVVLGLMGVA